MKKTILLCPSLGILSGCAKVAHVNELLTLKSLSDNQTQQQQYVKSENKKFEKLLEVVKKGRLAEDFPNQQAFLKAFGEPIFTKDVQKDGQALQKWLYRYTSKLKDSPKVYLYFSSSGRLVHYEYMEPPENKKEN